MERRLEGYMQNIRGDTSNIHGLLEFHLYGDVSRLSGDISNIIGLASFISGEVTNIRGEVSSISGDVSGISGDVTFILGNVSNLTGNVSGLRGNVSGLSGDATDISGDATRLKGDIKTLVEEGRLSLIRKKGVDKLQGPQEKEQRAFAAPHEQRKGSYSKGSASLITTVQKPRIRR